MIHPDLLSLCEDVDKIVVILRGYNISGWADVLEKGAVEIKASDLHGVIRLLHCYGGMGTLNDIIINEEDGEIFDALRNSIYEKANAIFQRENLVVRADFNPLN